MTRVRVTDAFGEEVDAEIRAAAAGTQCFVLSPPAGTDALAGVNLRICLATGPSEGAPYERVAFRRSEATNLMWAEEEMVAGTDADPAERRDAEPPVGASAPVSPVSALAAVARYELRSPLPAREIPSLPVAASGQAAGQIAFRRGRSDPAATRQQPQYKGRIVAESRVVDERAIPPEGVTVARVPRSTRAPDGSVVNWIGRRVTRGAAHPPPALDFDILRKP